MNSSSTCALKRGNEPLNDTLDMSESWVNPNDNLLTHKASNNTTLNEPISIEPEPVSSDSENDVSETIIDSDGSQFTLTDNEVVLSWTNVYLVDMNDYIGDYKTVSTKAPTEIISQCSITTLDAVNTCLKPEPLAAVQYNADASTNKTNIEIQAIRSKQVPQLAINDCKLPFLSTMEFRQKLDKQKNRSFDFNLFDKIDAPKSPNESDNETIRFSRKPSIEYCDVKSKIEKFESLVRNSLALNQPRMDAGDNSSLQNRVRELQKIFSI
jgi:hypothetical protein